MLNHSKLFSIFAITGLLSVFTSSCDLNWRSGELVNKPISGQVNTPPEDSPVANRLDEPVFNLDSGTYLAPQLVEVTGEEGTTLHCTSDGSTPTCTSSECTAFPNASAKVITYRAIACKTSNDWLPSAVVTASYIFQEKLTAPVYTPGSNNVSIDTQNGTTIHYTTDGSTPTCSNNNIYSSALPLSAVAGTHTIYSIACMPNHPEWIDSDISAYTYSVAAVQLNTPVFSPSSGTSNSAISFTITSNVGSTIHYTINGSAPTCSTGTTINSGDTVVTSSSPGTYLYQAIACETNWTNSAVGSATYVINGALDTPVFSPSSGTSNSAISFTITSNVGSTIHYTINGSAPTCSTGTTISSGSTVVTSGTQGTYLYQAIACETNWTNSAIGSATYVINTTPPTIVITAPNNGSNFTTDVLQQTISGTCSSDVTSIDVVSPAGATLAYNHCSIDGTWSLNQFTLDPLPSNGQNTFTVTAHSAVGNTASATIVISVQVGYPTFDPPFSGPIYYNELDVNMSSSTPGSVIHYKTDMTAPDCNTSSPLPLHITKSTSVWAIACKAGWGYHSGMIEVGYTLKVADPTFSPIAGTYVSAQNVAISTITNSSSIYYTTDGSTNPTCTGTGTLYTGAISIGMTTQIRAIGCRTDWPSSNVVTANYIITSPQALGTPVFSPDPLPVYTTAQAATITSAGADQIYYTVNGSTPSCGSGTLYIGSIPLDLDNTYTIQAIGCKTNWLPSAVGTAMYQITGQVVTPTSDLTQGTYTTTQIFTLSSSTSSSTIHYTSDGSTVTCSNGTSGASPLTVNLNTSGTYTYNVIACKTDWTQSTTASFTYTLTGTVQNPVFSPSSGVYTSTTNATITSTPSDATIYYTTDGTAPSCGSGNTYSGAIPLPTTPGTYTYKAIACKTSWITSGVTTAIYTYHCGHLELSNLTVSNNGLLDPVFNSATKVYDLNLPISGNAVSVVPTVASGCGVETTVDVNGIPGNSGDTFGPTDMSLFNTVATITITVTSQWDSGINNVYTLSATRGVTTQEAYIKKDTAPDYSEHFGSATAMSGNTLVVGMPGANGDIGAAYVYTRDTTGTWSLQQVLSLVGIGTAGDNFGSSVAIENNTIVVGAIGAEGNIVAGSGAAYVFTRSGTLWNGPYPLTQDSSVSTGDNFGCSVAISSGTIAVGSCNQTDSGAVYVFVGSGSSWHQQAMLQAAHRASKDEFGYSVSITGDRIAVGVPQESSNSVGINHNPSSWTNALLSGAVYVFERSGSVWTVSAYIKASNAMAGNQFGSSVKVAGSYLVVGAPYENSNGIGIGGDQSQPLTITPETKALYNISSGAVYVFKYISNTWTQGTDGYVKASNPSAYAYFGSSLDGGVSNTSVLVVGAPGESSDLTGIQYGAYTISNTAASGSGAAYVFIKNETLNTDRAQLAYIKASNTDAGDSFGSAVACNGDVVVVGAPYEDSNATGINCSGVNCELDNSIDDSGAVYTFY